MTPFEYVTVLLSIILGMGITQLVTGVADLVHHWQRVKIYWPHLLWIFFIFFLHLQEWWLVYTLRDMSHWRLPTFFFVSLYPLNLFVLARLLSPFTGQDDTVDLQVFYFTNCRKLFLWTLSSAVLAMATNLYFHSESFNDQIPQLLLVLTLGGMLASKTVAPWAHKLLAIILLVVVLGSMAVEWNEWVI